VVGHCWEQDHGVNVCDRRGFLCITFTL
jgi:hypothetical protein